MHPAPRQSSALRVPRASITFGSATREARRAGLIAPPALGYADDPIAAAQDADLLLHLTEWPAAPKPRSPGEPLVLQCGFVIYAVEGAETRRR